MRVRKHHNIKEIADVINQAYRKMPFLKDERITLQELEEIIEDANKRLYVCVDGKRICGTIALDVSCENIEMQLFAVHPDYQGKNIGCLLMQHVEQKTLHRWGKNYIYIRVIPLFQEKLVSYYERNGYIPIGAMQPFSNQNLKRYIKPEYWQITHIQVMRKDLKSSQ